MVALLFLMKTAVPI